MLTTRPRTTLLALVALLLAGSLVTVLALHARASGAVPAEHPHRYADYLGGSTTTEDPQCARPVAERTGGWIC